MQYFWAWNPAIGYGFKSAHRIGHEVCKGVRDDLLDALPTGLRAHPDIVVLLFQDNGHTVVDVDDGGRSGLGKQGTRENLGVTLSFPERP